MTIEKCKCGKKRSVNVGDRIRDGKYSWYMSSYCEYCGETFEMDGYDIFDIPYDVEQEIIKRDGEWGIIAKGSVTKINFVLNKIVNSEYRIDNIHKDNVIYTGTQEQVKWVKDRLVEKGISEKEIEIELLTRLICEKCHAEMNYRIEGHIQGWVCPVCCEWGIVTSYFSEIELDRTEYSIYIKSVENIDIDKIRVVSKIAGVNYIAAKQILEKGDTCILKAEAEDILEAISKLKNVNLPYEVTPEFNYQ